MRDIAVFGAILQPLIPLLLYTTKERREREHTNLFQMLKQLIRVSFLRCSSSSLVRRSTTCSHFLRILPYDEGDSSHPFLNLQEKEDADFQKVEKRAPIYYTTESSSSVKHLPPRPPKLTHPPANQRSSSSAYQRGAQSSDWIGRATVAKDENPP